MKFQITDDPNYVNREEICKQRMAEKRIELEPKIINAFLNCIQARVDNKKYRVDKGFFDQKVTIKLGHDEIGECIDSYKQDIGYGSWGGYSKKNDVYLHEIMKKVAVFIQTADCLKI